MTISFNRILKEDYQRSLFFAYTLIRYQKILHVLSHLFPIRGFHGITFNLNIVPVKPRWNICTGQLWGVCVNSLYPCPSQYFWISLPTLTNATKPGLIFFPFFNFKRVCHAELVEAWKESFPAHSWRGKAKESYAKPDTIPENFWIR